MIRERLPRHAASASAPPNVLTDLLATARPKQWIKNGFVFAALVFAGKLGQADLVVKTVVGFILFSLLSSTVYLLNDAAHAEADRKHPIKVNRPVAAGRIPVRLAVAVAVGLGIASLGVGALIDYQFGLVALGYLA